MFETLLDKDKHMMVPDMLLQVLEDKLEKIKEPFSTYSFPKKLSGVYI